MENKKCSVEEDSESKDSNPEEENLEKGYDPEENEEPNLKNKASNRKRSIVEEESASDDSDSLEENVDEDYDPEEVEPRRKKKPEKLSDYEMLVQKNKEEKLAFWDSLKMEETNEDVADTNNYNEADKPIRKKWTKRYPTKLRKLTHRSAKVGKNLSEEALEIKAMKEAYKSTEVVKVKKKTVIVQPKCLQFREAFIGDSSFTEFTEDFSGLSKGNTDPFYGYTSHFQNMRLLKTPYQVFDQNGYCCLDFHPMREKILLAAASTKNGALTFWNVNSDSDPYVFEPHDKGITHIRFNPERHTWILSSSKDKTLKCGDLVKGVFTEVYKESKGTNCNYFDFLSSNSFLLSHNRNGSISVIDYRTIGVARLTHKCHAAQMRSVSVHPVDKNYFISSEKNGAICLWDLRNLQKEPIAMVNNNSNNHLLLALFSPLTGKSILTSSHGKVSLYDSYLGSSLIYRGAMKIESAPQAGFYNNISRAMWIPNSDDAFVVQRRIFPRQIDIYNDRCINIFSFTDEKLIYFSPINIFHPSLPVLAGAEDKGRVFVLGVP